MWKIVWYFLGCCRVRILGGSPEWALQRLAEKRIAFREIRRIDPLTLELTILQRDKAKAVQAVAGAMCELRQVGHTGFCQTFGGLGKRPGLLIALAAIVFGAIFVPRFVFFYEVSGNERVPSALILRELQDAGVGFGTYGPSIHPQEVKNKLLQSIPALSWVTVQQSGMKAVVVVREREEILPVLDRKTPQNVIASRGGIITAMEATAGCPLVTVGQAVEEGQTLVSAYTDMEYKIMTSAAMAEIYAETLRPVTAVLPAEKMVKQATGRSRTQISLLVGRKRWNICGNSSIFAGNCGKMTSYKMLTLPGGLELPIGIAITRCIEYDTVAASREKETAQAQMARLAEDSVMADMIAGQIHSRRERFDGDENLLTYNASFCCEEMIARMVHADIIKDDVPYD